MIKYVGKDNWFFKSIELVTKKNKLIKFYSKYIIQRFKYKKVEIYIYE